MINIKETMDELEHMSGCNSKCIGDAIKVMKMWLEIKRDSCEFELIRCIEERYFPSVIIQTLTVKIHGTDEEHLRKVRENVYNVWGVKEVVQSDKDC